MKTFLISIRHLCNINLRAEQAFANRTREELLVVDKHYAEVVTSLETRIRVLEGR